MSRCSKVAASVEASRDTWIVVAVALVARLALAGWAGSRFPAIADGVYYDTLATRIASGAGYTWQWPDGVVTFAAHYPVGYPALLAVGYAVFGAGVTRAIGLNVLIGTLGSAAAHGLASRAMGARAALVAGVLCALEPAILFYLPAVMTEAVTAHLVVIAAYVAARAHEASGSHHVRWFVALTVVLGVATLVRPQCVLLAPLFGLLASRTTEAGLRGRVVAAALALGGALAVCVPWTLRNCSRMGRCALVSVNGGWNLLIGATPGSNGHWAPIEVPEGCRTVFDEAGKDVCFEAAARRAILDDPLSWLALVPKKLAATFDYAGAAPWYLHDANPVAFPWGAKVALAVGETVFHRVALVLALIAVGFELGERRALRRAVAMTGVAFAVLPLVTRNEHGGWVAHLALAVCLLLHGWQLLAKPTLLGASAAVLVTTAAVHAVFFGAGRYALPIYPFVTLLAARVLTGSPPWRDTPPHAPD